MENSENRPIIAIVISTPTKYLFIHALNSDKEIIGRLPGIEYDTNIAGASLYLFKTRFDQVLYYEWNGSVVSLDWKIGFLKYFDDGIYYLKVSALKMFGDISNKEDWESWISPPIKIQRKI